MPEASTPRRFRTILHGTCLVGGRHPEGSELARECPARRRQERRGQGGRYRDSGLPPEGKSGPTNPGTSDTVLRDIATGRAFRPGRPSLALAERRARARERKRRQRGIAGLLCPVGR